MSAKSINAIVSTKVEETLAVVAFGKDVFYDVSLLLMPTEQGPQPTIMITLSIDSLVIGQKHSAATVVPGPVPDLADVETAVTEVYNSLVEQASSLTP